MAFNGLKNIENDTRSYFISGYTAPNKNAQSCEMLLIKPLGPLLSITVFNLPWIVKKNGNILQP